MSRQTTDRMKGVFANIRRVFDALGRKVTQYEWRQGARAGHHRGRDPWAHARPHVAHRLVGQGQGLHPGRRHQPADLFVRNPDWHLMFDQDAKMADETRRKVYDMLVAEKMLVQGFHYPFPALAHIEKSGSGYREMPVPWSPVL